MNVRIKHNHWLPKLLQSNGVTIYPYIFLRFSKDLTPKSTYKHELIHAKQTQDLGWFSFQFSYLFYLLAGWIRYKNFDRGYYQIPYEIEAYKFQEKPFTQWEITVLETNGVNYDEGK